MSIFHKLEAVHTQAGLYILDHLYEHKQSVWTCVQQLWSSDELWNPPEGDNDR